MNALEWLDKRIEWHRNCLNGTPQKEIIPKLKRDLQMFEDMKKRIQALEIIKEKNVDVCILKDSDNVDEYNQTSLYATKYSNHYSFCKPLSQEEYDLLKEVLL